MKKCLVFIVCALIFVAASCTRSYLRYPVAGEYKGAAAQGMAIWGDNAYLLSDGGRCRVYNLRTQTVQAEFMLASARAENHVNTACFGCEFAEGGDKPALYVTECYGDCRLFVENVFEDRSELVQTIRAVDDGKPLPVNAWTVDVENRVLYCFSTGWATGDEVGTRANVVSKFRLPRLDEGAEVIFTENDVLDRFIVYFPNLTQGITLRGHYLYMVTGNAELSTALNRYRALKVIDLRKRELTKSIDLTYVTTSEPEDIDFYRGRMLMYCGGDGGLYEIRHR